ncbi:hypothetical protein N431DRAFT_173048 [Stipitochalara longipes BDJ]|nr:hypothetical protein N431DRAFT_173048 [Stipitochalara longipes BDJ]
MVQRHCPQPGSTRSGTPGHRSSSRSSEVQRSALSAPSTHAPSTLPSERCLCNTGTLSRGLPAAYAFPDSSRGSGKSASSCLGNLGGVGVQQGLFEAAVLSGLSPSPSGPTMKNSGVTVPFLRQSSPTERTQPFQSVNRSLCHFKELFLLGRGHDGRNEKLMGLAMDVVEGCRWRE